MRTDVAAGVWGSRAVGDGVARAGERRAPGEQVDAAEQYDAKHSPCKDNVRHSARHKYLPRAPLTFAASRATTS